MTNRKLLSTPILLILIFYAPVFAPFLPRTEFGAGIPDMGLVQICLFLWLIAFAMDIAVKNTFAKRDVSLYPWNFVVFGYSGIILISLTWSVESYSSANISKLFFNVVVPSLIVISLKFYIISTSFIKKVVKHAAMSCFLLSSISVIKFLTYGGSDLKMARSGIGGLDNPNALAIFLVLCVPVILYGIMGKIISNKWGLFVLLMAWGGVLCTISRKGFITLVLSYVIFFFFKKAYKSLIACFIVSIIAISVIYINPFFSQRYAQESVEKQFAGKWNMAKAGFDMFTKKPVLGWGYKGYYNNFGRYFKDAAYKKYEAHNNYVTALANYGIVGFSFFLGLFLIPLFKSFKNRKKDLKANTLISFLIPFMMSAWFAGKLMYLPVVVNLLFLFIVVFSYTDHLGQAS